VAAQSVVDINPGWHQSSSFQKNVSLVIFGGIDVQILDTAI